MADRPNTLPDGTYIVLVRSLYATLIPSTIMAVAFVGVAAHVASETPDFLLELLALLGGGAVVVRLIVLLLFRHRARSDMIDLAGARQIERLFALSYFAFAAIFGVFAARAFQIATAESHMLVVGLLFGYGAGVAAGIFLRPWIALPSILLAIVPSIVVALTMPDHTYFTAGVLLLLFLAGGIHSMMRNFRTAAAEITARRTFATLARADALTGLDNRLSLREEFDRALMNSGPKEMLVVHCLDLDRFKAVNDTFGHPVGDALLQAVADRLRRTLRNGDVAARVGGDEFVLVQTGAQHRGEAELFARRLSRTLSEPYAILDHRLSVGTSVGYVLCPEHGSDLDDLIARADEALIRVKREGGGVALYQPESLPDRRRLSA
ncbi:GGDEF domain-containing protein [Sphingosinicella sp. CPCC 101087]|uniref:GGDEF domain-containing protein n=1 Tax=Sphingosinicella sp. CPCC 101087 TaxID=2497754 RepID=UPI00101B71E6|nr:GGDEF domain-containing protein [Sphingosinicella sp. CPCC 101087]